MIYETDEDAMQRYAAETGGNPADIPVLPSTLLREQILESVSQERQAQINKGYDQKHDVTHGGWPHLINESAQRMMSLMGQKDVPLIRIVMIQVIALLIAAVELLSIPEKIYLLDPAEEVSKDVSA